MDGFASRLREAAVRKNSRVVVGLDPRWDWLPPFLREEAVRRHGGGLEAIEWGFRRFNEEIIAAVAAATVAVKVQAAFYFQYGWQGVRAMQGTLDDARRAGLLTIIDAKVNDIATSAEAYAGGFLGRPAGADGTPAAPWDADALTVNPYLGTDGLLPFVRVCDAYGKGIFVLVRTSNPSGGELQALAVARETSRTGPPTDNGTAEVATLADVVASRLEELNVGRTDEYGYGPVGAVVGATYPEEAARLRSRMPSALFLLPGYGAQGAGADDVARAFDSQGWGAVVNSSRGICFAYRQRKDDPEGRRFAEAAADAAEAMRREIASVIPPGPSGGLRGREP